MVIWKRFMIMPVFSEKNSDIDLGIRYKNEHIFRL